ncbi:hypothetical protein [Aurantimonas endophytica]|uniref:Uncharacterized protein n=1 Tax=Aurantimonas endophytica TaxID=1522175 RepID=A0A7W6HFW5_9HYPH|nr:hypothetical protein [Aurantimonas endophytica]MBB4004464.1 hypothetical protein [Aurantimonas endophytica]MCO6405300.1 hypothetical protein [Aurantimonas endophytica]
MPEWVREAAASGWAAVPAKLDPGWATLIAALFGFLIVSWQARSGFRSLKRSQIHQAELDREAMAQQAEIAAAAQLRQSELDRSAAEESRSNDRQVIAAAIDGELIAIWGLVLDAGSTRRLNKFFYEQIGETKITAPFRIIGRHETPVYDSMMPKIGALNASMVTDVVKVYQFIKGTQTDNVIKEVPGKLIVDIIEGFEHTIEEWTKDVSHVHARLLSVIYGSEDPGPLINDQISRKKAKEAAATAATPEPDTT